MRDAGDPSSVLTMATLVLVVLSLAAVATAMGHGSTTTLEITASDKDSGTWTAKVGDTKVSVEHQHPEGSIGSGEWMLKLSHSSDWDERNDISEDRRLQQRHAKMDDAPEGSPQMQPQDSYSFPPAPATWQFQVQPSGEPLTPPAMYQESLPVPDSMIRPPPALPPYSYNMPPTPAQYPLPPAVPPKRMERTLLPAPFQPYSYNAMRYEPETQGYNLPAYNPTFEANNHENPYMDIAQPNLGSQTYLQMWQSPESNQQQGGVMQQDSYVQGAYGAQQNQGRVPEPVHTYQYPAVVIPAQLASMGQAAGKVEYSNGMLNNQGPEMAPPTQNQPSDTRIFFPYAPSFVPDSMGVSQQPETQTNDNSTPEPSSDSEQKYVVVEALVVANPEAQQLSREENPGDQSSYKPEFGPGAYTEDIEGLKAPQPLPLLANERVLETIPDGDYSAPSYGMAPPAPTEQRSPSENEVVPDDDREVQDYQPYIGDIAFRPKNYVPVQETDKEISYVPTSILKGEGAGPIKMVTATLEEKAGPENQQ